LRPAEKMKPTFMSSWQAFPFYSRASQQGPCMKKIYTFLLVVPIIEVKSSVETKLFKNGYFFFMQGPHCCQLEQAILLKHTKIMIKPSQKYFVWRACVHKYLYTYDFTAQLHSVARLQTLSLNNLHNDCHSFNFILFTR